MLTLKKVNAAIAAEGGTAELIRGEGYFYFAEGEADEWDFPSVYVFLLNDLPLDRWLGEYRDRRDAHKQGKELWEAKIAENDQQAVNRSGAQNDARANDEGSDKEHGERDGSAADTGTEVQNETRAAREMAEMTGKYGRMPPRPDIRAKVRGDAGVYAVWGFDWMEHRVLMDRAGLEWVDIARVEIIESGDSDA